MGRKKKQQQKNQITIIFYLQVEDNEEYLQQQTKIEIQKGILTYYDLVNAKRAFLEQNFISYENYMHYTTGDNQLVMIDNKFQMKQSEINDQYQGVLLIMIESYTKTLKQYFESQVQELRQIIKGLEQKINMLPLKDELEMLRRNSMPIMSKTISTANRTYYQYPQLDIGVLFSQPIFQQKKNKPAKKPVDFRSQIERLKTALKSAPRQQIKIKCQRATIQNLKHLIRHEKPRILHIISHGATNGSLQFEDDSLINLGYLRIVSTQDIIQALQGLKNNLPQIVFVNTCYSEKVGHTFFTLGVKYVIMIDSADSIEDQAAQIFSEHFYRNIFKGQLVTNAFNSAKKQVLLKHNSFGCCCNHSAQEPHKIDCLWNIVKKQIGRQKAHKLYHLPSSQCTCELRNYNRHKTQCKWAIRALFNINRNFRKLNEQTNQYCYPKKSQISKYLFFNNQQLVVCCCFQPGKIPHSQSHKFKFETNQDKKQALYDVKPGILSPSVFVEQQLIQVNQYLPQDFMGRQQQLYCFLKLLKSHQNIYILYGISGVGKTAFVCKAATYCVERKVYDLFYYIDLYDIKDKNLFRPRFNEITTLKYDGKMIMPSVKQKKIVLILDNCDQFFSHQKSAFYEEMNILKSELIRSKIIIIMKKETYSEFQFLRLHSEKFELSPLNSTTAAQIMFFKLKHQLDISVEYSHIFNLIKIKQQAKCPKVIESICHSLSDKGVGTISTLQIQEKISMIGNGQNAIHQLINNNLEKLKQKSPQAYEMLIFMSQFSQGLNYDDLTMFSLANRQQTVFQMPIKKNWMEHFQYFFENFSTKQILNVLLIKQLSMPQTQQQLPESIPVLTHNSSKFSADGQISQNQQLVMPKGQSYFVQQVGKNTFAVKRFIRDFLWRKYINDTNHYMKFLFVAFTSIFVQNILENLVKEHYIHQKLIFYTPISISGPFSLLTTISANYQISLTQSTKLAQQFQYEIERIITQNKSLQFKLKSKDHTQFLNHHKQDVLNIYDYKWQPVYNYLVKKQNKQNYAHKIFLTCFQNLLLYIPAMLSICNCQSSLIIYAISKSKFLLKQFKAKSQIDRNLKIYLKLSLMEIQCELEQRNPDINKIQECFDDIQKNFSHSENKFMASKEFNRLRGYFYNEKKFIQIYLQFFTMKNDFKQMIEKFKSALLQQFVQCEEVHQQHNGNTTQSKVFLRVQQIFKAKKDLYFASIFLTILTSAQRYEANYQLFTLKKIKNDYYQKVIHMLNNSIAIFHKKKLVKLLLKAKLAKLSLIWEFVSDKGISKPSITLMGASLSQCKELVLDCQKIFHNRHNKLGGITQFDVQIKKLKRQINQRLWQSAKNTIIFMRSIPIWYEKNGKKFPILENLVRKKNNFKSQIQLVLRQKVFIRRQSRGTVHELRQPSLRHMMSEKRDRKTSGDASYVDISAKFDTFNPKKLAQQMQSGCSIMFITAHTIVNAAQKVFIVFEGTRLQQESIQVDQSFINMFNFKNIRILIIFGQNSIYFIRKLNQLLKARKQNKLVLIAISENKQQKLTYEACDESMFGTFIHRQLKKQAFYGYVKQFLRKVKNQKITVNEEVQYIHKQAIKKINNNKELLQLLEFEIIIDNPEKQINIQFKEGMYKDLSPGYEGNHNLQLRLIKNQPILRRWHEISSILTYLIQRNSQKAAAYINIYGQKSSGKSFFMQQLAKLLIERQFYNYAVYIFKGEQINKYNGDIQAFIVKQSKKARLPSLQYFLQASHENLILMIDDFHLIKPKSQWNFKMFIEKIIKRKINIIISTNDSKNISDTFPGIKSIKVSKMKQQENNLIFYNLIDYNQKDLINIMQKVKQQWNDGASKLTISQIIQKHKSKNQTQPNVVINNYFKPPTNQNAKSRQKQNEMKKIHSERM